MALMSEVIRDPPDIAAGACCRRQLVPELPAGAGHTPGPPRVLSTSAGRQNVLAGERGHYYQSESLRAVATRGRSHGPPAYFTQTGASGPSWRSSRRSNGDLPPDTGSPPRARRRVMSSEAVCHFKDREVPSCDGTRTAFRPSAHGGGGGGGHPPPPTAAPGARRTAAAAIVLCVCCSSAASEAHSHCDRRANACDRDRRPGDQKSFGPSKVQSRRRDRANCLSRLNRPALTVRTDARVWHSPRPSRLRHRARDRRLIGNSGERSRPGSRGAIPETTAACSHACRFPRGSARPRRRRPEPSSPLANCFSEGPGGGESVLIHGARRNRPYGDPLARARGAIVHAWFLTRRACLRDWEQHLRSLSLAGFARPPGLTPARGGTCLDIVGGVTAEEHRLPRMNGRLVR